MRQRFFYLFVLATLLVSCSGGKVKYRIGISQCSDDIWRDKRPTIATSGRWSRLTAS